MREQKRPESRRALHTPGPWKVYHARLRPQFSGKIIEVQSDSGRPVVAWSGFDNSDRLKKTHLANARLIAAAPNMLRALERIDAVFSRLQCSEDEAEAFAELDRALAKVRGASQ